MNFDQALEYVHSLASRRGLKLGLDRVLAASRILGSPHEAFSAVQIAGTNGKGSVAAMIAAVLEKAGISAGLYTSPHIHRITERIRIDSQEISRHAFAKVCGRMAALENEENAPALTFFEALTLMAFMAFKDHGVRTAVLETGLGGRLDACSIANPSLCVITTVSLDHTHILGGDIASIAAEKAGILKPHVPLVTGRLEKEAMDVVLARAHELECDTWCIDRDFTLTGSGGHEYEFNCPWGRTGAITCGLGGEFQLHNAACALAAVHILRKQGLKIRNEHITAGIKSAKWNCRFEIVNRECEIVLDAAHNVHAIEALSESLDALPSARARCVLLFGALKDKAVNEMLAPLRRRSDEVFLVKPDVDRGLDPAQYALKDDVVCSSAREALEKCIKSAGEGGRVVVTGSIFLAAEIRGLLYPDEVRDPMIDL